MKLDLSSLIRGREDGWNVEAFKKQLQSSLIEIIRLELENLPEEEWSKTLSTWVKICRFCNEIMKKHETQRQELYKKFGFDPTMVHVSESVIEKLQTAKSFKLLGEKDPPENIIKVALEGIQENSKSISFMKSFFKV
ncbi:MAG: hypothetical protein NZ531_00330 [Aquificaceae bacterium]|nr:hypothetical protein [Aquificaceae bacterium]